MNRARKLINDYIASVNEYEIALDAHQIKCQYALDILQDSVCVDFYGELEDALLGYENNSVVNAEAEMEHHARELKNYLSVENADVVISMDDCSVSIRRDGSFTISKESENPMDKQTYEYWN